MERGALGLCGQVVRASLAPAQPPPLAGLASSPLVLDVIIIVLNESELGLIIVRNFVFKQNRIVY